jgi:DNA-3-methyladenine glycosylase II
MHSYLFPLTGTCNWQHLLARIKQSSHGAFYRAKDGRLGCPLRLGQQSYFVEVAPTDDQAHWQVQIHQGDQSLEAAATKALRHLFALDVDLSAFYQHSRHDPHVADITEQLSGARMVRDRDPFTSVISSIISQQLNLAFAATLKRRLWLIAGQPLQVEGEQLYADPTPEAIARLDYTTLRNMQYSQRKAEYVIDFARAVVDGRFSLERLAELDDEEAIAYLSSQRGVGRWTAECVLLFGLGRPDLLPAKDVGLQRAVERCYRLPHRPDEQEIRQLAASWHPWSSWYTYYLWLSLAYLPDSQ